MTDAKTPPRRRRHLRRALVGGLALLAILAGLHGAAWHWSTGALAVGFSDWATTRRAQGWVIRHGLPERGGWPFAARLTVPGLHVEGWDMLAPAGFTLESDRFVLEVSPTRPDRLVLRAEGRQYLATDSLALPFSADRFEIFLPLDPGGPLRGITAEADRLRLTTADGPAEFRQAHLAVTPQRPLPDAEPSLRIGLRAEGGMLPPSPPAAALGREVEALSLTAEILPFAPIPGSPRARAQAWRDAGGLLELRSLALRWGTLAGEAQMRLSLDPALQPRGTGALQLAGAAEALGGLARAGLIAPGAARAAQAMVVLMARPGPDGGPARLEAPITLENGVLAVARLPVLRLAPLRWPDAAFAMPRR